MNRYKTYQEAEDFLVKRIVFHPDFITKNTFEIIGTGFVLKDPYSNTNNRSNYQYADEFFNWMMTGQKDLSSKLIELNPWVKRFVDSGNLPESFSSTYGWKIREQLNAMLDELKINRESRRAYFKILQPGDDVILRADTTHEYPCTIGLQLFIRDELLHMVVNMRSNNVYSVMPYDVYNFTMLQQHIAKELKKELGYYHHQINSAHIFKGDVRRVREKLIVESD